MRESKYQLQKWTTWKRTIQLLKKTKEQIQDTRKCIRYDTEEMSGGNHTSIHQQMERIILECRKYDDTITVYEFFVNRLEEAVNSLLTEEEKKVVLIYASNQTAKKREIEALHKGYSEKTFYRKLNEALDKLDSVLNPKVGVDSKMTVK